MKQFHLAEIETKDRLIHQGLFYRPKKSGRKAILFVHGLSSTFYAGKIMLEAFAVFCEKEGVGFAVFNNRGHDLISSTKKVDSTNQKGYTHTYGGAGYEVFEECVFDIESGVEFLKKQGFSQIILVGHSTGCNKICYTLGTLKLQNVSGVVLLSPLSDRLDPQAKIPWYLFSLARLFVRFGWGDKLITGVSYFPGTTKRFLSLFSPHSNEDTFDYGDTQPKMMLYSKIREPLLVVFGGNDELMDRPVKEIQKIFNTFQHSKKYKSLVILNALHSFNGKEEVLVHAIDHWIKTTI